MRNKYWFCIFGILLIMLFTSCSENYSNGERIGTITRFSKKGLIWKSWEGTMNITQTGMNTSGEPFNFSIDNDNQNDSLVKIIDECTLNGYKVKLKYHQVRGWNVCSNRGETDYFVESIIILDKNFATNPFTPNSTQQINTGKALDTIYVLIIDKNRIKN